MIYYEKTLSGHLQELKSKGKIQLGKSQEWLQSLSGAVGYESFLLERFKSQFKQGLTNVVITRADHLWEWSQGGFQPYLYLNFSTL